MNLNAGLLGWWCPSLSLSRRGSTIVSDLSQHANNGTCVKMSMPSAWLSDTHKFGTVALNFDGVDDSVTIGNVSRLKAAFPITVSAWVKFDTLPAATARTIFANDDYQNNRGIQLRTSSATAGALIVGFGDGASSHIAITTSALAINQWYHVCGHINGNGGCVPYVDGVRAAHTTSGAATTISYTSADVQIGRGVTGVLMDGLIDDVRIWNRLLTAHEIMFLASRRAAVADVYNIRSRVRAWAPPAVSSGNRRRRVLIASS